MKAGVLNMRYQQRQWWVSTCKKRTVTIPEKKGFLILPKCCFLWESRVLLLAWAECPCPGVGRQQRGCTGGLCEWRPGAVHVAQNQFSWRAAAAQSWAHQQCWCCVWDSTFRERVKTLRGRCERVVPLQPMEDHKGENNPTAAHGGPLNRAGSVRSCYCCLPYSLLLVRHDNVWQVLLLKILVFLFPWKNLNNNYFNIPL